MQSLINIFGSNPMQAALPMGIVGAMMMLVLDLESTKWDRAMKVGVSLFGVASFVWACEKLDSGTTGMDHIYATLGLSAAAWALGFLIGVAMFLVFIVSNPRFWKELRDLPQGFAKRLR